MLIYNIGNPYLLMAFSKNQLISGLKNGSFNNICVMTGAGISVSAGIPDFRSPDTGIYARVEEILGYKLPTPESLFDVKYMIKNPVPYYTYRKVRFFDKDY
jgi:NAD-dependent SIR2 family protein deacetylase